MRLFALATTAWIASVSVNVSAFRVRCEGRNARFASSSSSPSRLPPITSYHSPSSPRLGVITPKRFDADSKTSIASSIADPMDFIRSEISANDVVIFSTTYCPHCVHTKQLFVSMNTNAKIIDLDLISNGLGPAEDSVAVKVYEMTGQRTVPNVFIKGNHLGGDDRVQAAARSGELERILMSSPASRIPTRQWSRWKPHRGLSVLDAKS